MVLEYTTENRFTNDELESGKYNRSDDVMSLARLGVWSPCPIVAFA